MLVLQNDMKRKNLLIDVTSILGYVQSGYVSGIGRSTFELLRALNRMASCYAWKERYINQ